MMMKYSSFETEDFLLDKDFVLWIKEGKGDVFWQRFLTEFPEKAETVQQAGLLVKAASTLPGEEPDTAQRKAMWMNIQQNISSEEQRRQEKITPLFRKGWGRWVAVASIILAAGTGWWMALRKEAVKLASPITVARESSADLIAYVNRGDKVMPVDLPDGSSVLLEKNSSLSFYHSRFGKALREVNVSGEAFFEVAKNPEKPFKVYANELITEVLGTSFVIRAYPEDTQVDVRVKTGKVAVYTQRKGITSGRERVEEIVLTPNQQISLNRREMTLSDIREGAPSRIVPEDLYFDYDDVLVTTVFGQIENAYGVELVYDRERLRNCRITASFTSEPLYEKIRLICKGLDASYQVVDTRIVIHSEGCH